MQPGQDPKEILEQLRQIRDLDNYELPHEVVCDRCEESTLLITRERLEELSSSKSHPNMRCEMVMAAFGWRNPSVDTPDICPECYWEENDPQ